MNFSKIINMSTFRNIGKNIRYITPSEASVTKVAESSKSLLERPQLKTIEHDLFENSKTLEQYNNYNVSIPETVSNFTYTNTSKEIAKYEDNKGFDKFTITEVFEA